MENKQKCRICGNIDGNQYFRVKEMLIGTRDVFEYFECNNCKTIQIRDFPGNISEFYPLGYYSFQIPKQKTNPMICFLIRTAKKKLIKYHAGNLNFTGFILSALYKNPFPWMTKEMTNFNARFLDVGSGAGKLLLSMERSGFKNLTGIDPYIEHNIEYPGRVKILKNDLREISGIYDFIMFHHSFEHMDSPLQILISAFKLLRPGGLVLIRIPVASCFAWRKYRESWFELDAPRHFFIHSKSGMQLLCRQSGFIIENIVYDSTFSQFTVSERYLTGNPLLTGQDNLDNKQLRFFIKEAKRLNHIQDGDSACFYLRRPVKS